MYLKEVFVCTVCSLAELWEEWNIGFVRSDRERTPALRDLCASQDQSWRGTKGAKMRNLLARRKQIWVAMEALYNSAQGSPEEKQAHMLEMAQGIKGTKSLNWLSEHFRLNPVEDSQDPHDEVLPTE